MSEEMNYLAEMLDKDYQRTDPYYLKEMAYERPEDLQYIFFDKLEKHLKKNRKGLKKIFRKKQGRNLSLRQLVELFDYVLTYQSANYFRYRQFYTADYPFNFEWLEEDEKDEIVFAEWISNMNRALSRCRDEAVTDHQNDGIIAIQVFLNILKPYGIPMKEFYEAWIKHLDWED